MIVTCHACKRAIHEGETAWASDWKVIGRDETHIEVRYTCDECATA